MPAALLLSVPSCREAAEARRDPAWLGLEAERVKLAHQVELRQLRLARLEGRDDEFIERSSELDEGAARHALLAEKAERLRAEVLELAALAERERSEWRLARRGATVGQNFAQLAGRNGRTFDEVVITRVTDVGIEFRHATGTARLAAEDLSSEQQGLFGIDPGISGEALQQEQATARAFDDWVDSRVAATAVRDESNQAALRATAAARPDPQPVMAAAGVAEPRNRLRDEPREFGRGTVWYPTYYPRTRYYYTGTGYYCRPSTSPVRSYPNIRVASYNWSFTPRSGSCASPVVSPRSSSVVSPRSSFNFSTP